MTRFHGAVFASAIGLSAMAGPVFAADLPAPASPPQAPTVYIPASPPFSWTGFYLGANAGYGWGNGSGSFNSGTVPFSASGNAFNVGGQLGYNYQYGPAVFGLEADFQGNVGGTASVTSGLGNVALTEPWFGSGRARIGYAFDRLMIYATGGGAYGRLGANGTMAATAFSSSTNYWTWTAGAGAEWAFYGPWSAKIEYLYAGTPSSLPPLPVNNVSGSGSMNLVRAGINYHF